MLLSIIIPAHNESKIISQTLNHVATLLPKHCEIIVVCDACTDDTAIQAQKTKNVTIVTVNVKSAALARNAGAKVATGNYLLFLDADTLIVDVNTITQSIDLLKQDVTIKVVGSYWHSKEEPEGSLVYLLLTNWFLYLTNTCPGFYLCCRKDEFIPFETKEKNEDIHWCKAMTQVCQNGRVHHFKEGEIETSMRRLKRQGLMKTLTFYATKQSCDMFFIVLFKIVIFVILFIVVAYFVHTMKMDSNFITL